MTNRDFVLTAVKRMPANASFQKILLDLDELLLIESIQRALKQDRRGKEIPAEEVRAGDILWWPGHVGIYTGYGWMVDALDHRHGVVRRPAKDPYRAFRPEDTEMR